MPRPRAIVEYNFNFLPSRITWSLAVDIPRNEVGYFCERLDAVIEERRGGVSYQVDLEQNTNQCRYEWHRRRDRDRFGWRLGLRFEVTSSSITQIEGYATPKEFINSAETLELVLEPELAASIQQELVDTVIAASRPPTQTELKEWQVIYHVDTMYCQGFSAPSELAGGRVKIFPTRFLRKTGRRITPLLVNVTASSRDGAQALAAHSELMLTLVLLSLAERQRYDLAEIPWPKSRPFKAVRPADAAIEEATLYPKGTIVAAETMIEGIVGRFDLLWEAFNRLTPEAKSRARDALFAYYSALGSANKLATVSVVSHLAALGALSKDKREKCSGDVTCSTCGALSWRHDRVSETGAITQTILEMCDITEPDRQRVVKGLVRRVHGEQRSAYVHAAQLRHFEYTAGQGQPGATPSNEAATQKVYEYLVDSQSIATLTRSTLIAWIFRQSNTALDFARFGIEPNRVPCRGGPTGRISLSGRIEARMFFHPPIDPAT